MASLLNIATLSARTFQRALDVTSHNIANVSTEGYNRQRVEIVANAPQTSGASSYGRGSRIDSIERVYADYIWRQQLQATSLYQRYDGALANAKSVEGVIAANDGGVQTFLQRFYDSLHNLANEPLSNVNRQMLLDEATNLESHIQNITTFLNDHQTQANAQINSLVDSINEQLDVIQRANDAVFRARDQGTFPPNDLLDQREQAIMKLGELIDVRTFEQPNGHIDVYIGNGKLPLLSDNTRVPITAERSPYTDENRTEVYLQISGQKRVVSDLISGGQLGGVLDYRKNMLDPAQRELGLALNGFVNSFNLQHKQGWDLNGNVGGDFFQNLNAQSIAHRDNTETDGSLITVQFATPANSTLPNGLFDEIALYQPRDYRLQYDAGIGAFRVYDHETGAPIQDSSGADITIAPGSSQVVDGLEVSVATGGYADGDRFILKPHEQMLQDFRRVLDDPNAIATRGEDPNNSGNPAGDGDNTNVANLANLASRPLLYADAAGQPSETILGGYSRMASNVGLYTYGVQISLDAQQNVLDQVTQRREALSGVNLDEEAANLMRYQQAYQAAAQMIQVSNTLFDTLIGVIR